MLFSSPLFGWLQHFHLCTGCYKEPRSLWLDRLTKIALHLTSKEPDISLRSCWRTKQSWKRVNIGLDSQGGQKHYVNEWCRSVAAGRERRHWLANTLITCLRCRFNVIFAVSVLLGDSFFNLYLKSCFYLSPAVILENVYSSAIHGKHTHFLIFLHQNNLNHHYILLI